MDRRSSCYLNSAYNRNVDDFDDYIDDESHLSFNSSHVGAAHSYDSENETYVDAYLFDDHDSCFSEDDQLAAFDENQIGNRSYSLQQLQRYHHDTYAHAIATTPDSKKYPDRVTSTPKKQQPPPPPLPSQQQQQQQQQFQKQQPLQFLHHHQSLTPSGRKNPQRRGAIVRRRSLSSLSYLRADSTFGDLQQQRGGGGGGGAATSAAGAIRRSKSSLSLRPRHLFVDQQQQQQQQLLQQQWQQQQQQFMFQSTAVAAAAAAAAATRLNLSGRYAGGGGGSSSDATNSSVMSTPTRPSRNLHNVSEPMAMRLQPSVSAAISPFQIRQKALMQSSTSASPLSAAGDARWSISDSRNRSQGDVFCARNPFLRRPYDVLNSSCSSSRPLVSRNTAVISPIYSNGGSGKSALSPFDVDSSRVLSVSAGDRSMCSSTKTTSSLSWYQQMRKPRLPLCTLRTSAITLLVSGTLTCLLCIHIMAQRGKSYELTFSLISGFIILCLGFPCLRFQEWQWLPNRNYVSGYIILSVFSVLQSAALWLLDKYPTMQPEWIDLTKGALCALSSLSLSVAVLGVCASCCCKYPPPDNRVNHGVQGFTV